MSTHRFALTLRLLGLVGLALLPRAAAAIEPRPAATPLAEKEFFKPELSISSANVRAAAVLDQLSDSRKEALQRLADQNGGPIEVYLDPRSGTPSSIVGSIPLVPGTGAGNRLTLAEVSARLARAVPEIDARVVGDLVRGFVTEKHAALGIDPGQLGPARAQRVTDELWHISIPQQVAGVPVRYGRIAATINHGNLVLLGTETWGNVRVDVTPRITAEQALAIGFTYAGGTASDELWAKPGLEIVPFAPPERQAGESFAGPLGLGYGHRLVWAFGLARKGEDGRYEALVDAHTGEVLSFEDRNQYESAQVTGGIYPLTNTGICPSSETCGVLQSLSPMPFANTGLPIPDNFTDAAGVFEYPGGTVTTTLDGRFVRVVDTCGAISASSATGPIDLGGLNNDHDCTTAGGSAGNTAASRSSFYEVNKLIEQAKGWLPGNAWLAAQITSNVNLNQTCNAFYSPSNGTINFYRTGGGCRNTGEIAAVFDHEWGHALDDNDTAGALSNPSEAYADIAAIYRLQSSCVGYGFFESIDDGCGQTADGTGFNANENQNGGSHCNLDCSGVRDADYLKHADGLPDTPASFVCGQCASGSGPCGRQVHCSAAPSRQAAWDFAARDLQGPPFDLRASDAFVLANRIFYQGSGNIGSWHACTCPSTSDGCGATNAYMQWLAADDDNGNLTDGTPHMTALYAAFNRHGIACQTPAPVDSGCAGAPVDAPELTVGTGNNQLDLSWTPVAAATAYRVLRTEGYAGCEFGKALIATVPGTSYTDPEVANGRPYYYVVQPVGTTPTCAGPGSGCVSGTPQPCAGSVGFDSSIYTCADSVGLTLVDSDLTGAGSHIVSVRSTTESSPESLVLTETPPGSGRFTGSIPTTSAPAAGGDGLLSVAHGDTITVGYVDGSFCGEPDVLVERSRSVDCQGPVITNVRAENVAGNSADIKWDTNEPATSQVVYGAPPTPGTPTPVVATLVLSHTLKVQPLTECSSYVYEVVSTDAAGNASAATNGGNYFPFETGQNVTPTYAYSGPPVPIPDNNPTGAQATVAVADTDPILDVNVLVHITHTYDGDLELSLRGPDNTVVTLADNVGGTGENFNDTVFDDEAATSITAGSAPYAGSFRPSQALTAFDGKIPAGTWTFKVVDQAGVDVGTIDRFEVNFTYPAQACGPSLKYKSHTTADTCDGSGSGGGNGVVEPGETLSVPVTLENNGSAPTTGIAATLVSLTPGVTVTSASSSYPDLAPDAQAAGATSYAVYVDPSVACGTAIQLRIDASANEGAWSGTFSVPVGAPGSATNTYSATDLPKPIPDVSVTTSTIAVSDTGTVSDVNVGLTLTHTYDGDLDIFLIGPNGTRVELSSDNGGTGENFTDTVFDDEAGTSITAGTPPYAGSFRAEGSLATLDGISANGNWTLEITDDAGADVGNLLDWHVVVATSAPPICDACAVLAPPGEVGLLMWSAGVKNALQWSSVGTATSYNLYRGDPADLPYLLDASVDSCLRLSTAGTSSGGVLDEEPADGSFVWYEVRAQNSIGEGPAGNATSGPRSQESSGACP